MARRRTPLGLAALAVGALAAGAALAQTPVQPSQNVAPPERVAPGGGDTTGSTNLSDKLQASDGVIKPPAGMDSGIVTRGPVPNPGTTPVIPPAGTPGSARPNADPR